MNTVKKNKAKHNKYCQGCAKKRIINFTIVDVKCLGAGTIEYHMD